MRNFSRGEAGVMLLRALLVVLLAAGWELGVRRKLIDPFFFSRPSLILADLNKILVSGEILPHLKITLKEAFIGLAAGTVSGIVVAFVLGRLELLARVLDPIMVALYGIPKLALGPLFILWFGVGIKSKIFMSAIMVFFLIFFNTYAGYRNVDRSLVNAVRLMGGSGGQILRKVILPSCVPWILAGLRAALGASLLGALVGEYIGAEAGLGWMIQSAGGMYDTTRVMSCIVLLTAIMALGNVGLKITEKRLLKWQPTE